MSEPIEKLWELQRRQQDFQRAYITCMPLSSQQWEEETEKLLARIASLVTENDRLEQEIADLKRQLAELDKGKQ